MCVRRSKLDCKVLAKLPSKTILLGALDLADMSGETPTIAADRIRARFLSSSFVLRRFPTPFSRGTRAQTLKSAGERDPFRRSPPLLRRAPISKMILNTLPTTTQLETAPPPLLPPVSPPPPHPTNSAISNRATLSRILFDPCGLSSRHTREYPWLNPPRHTPSAAQPG